MKKFVAFVLVVLLSLPILFTGKASAGLVAPTDFQAYGYGKDMKLQWKYSGAVDKNLKIEVFEYDYTSLKWKSLDTTPYQPDIVIPDVSYGRHIYKVRAELNGQYSDFSNTDTGFILKAPGGKPIVSLNKFTPPSFKGEMAVTIKWPAVKDAFTTHIGVYRKKPNGSYKLLEMVDKSKTSYKDADVQPNTKYIYTIVNMRKDGKKMPDFSVAAVQSGSTLTYPAPVKNFTAKGNGSKVILKWDRQKYCDGIKVYKQISTLKWTLVRDLSNAVVQFTLLNQSPGKYTYQVVAYNASGNAPNSVAKTAFVLKTIHISSVKAVAPDEAHIYFTSLDPNATGIDTFYSKDGKTFNSIGIITLKSDTKYVRVKGLKPDTKVYFKIAATRGENESAQSNAVSVTTPKESTAPKAPSDLKAALTEEKNVLLTWKDNADNETGFKVYRKESSETNFKMIADLPTDISETKYVDKTVSPGKTYTYRVVAYNSVGSANSNDITITTPSNAVQQTVIKLQPDNEMMLVNGVQQEIDPGRGTKPVIIPKWGRTVVPIRAIVEALGGTISWDGTERKVTINFNGTTIELWIGKPQARVNGEMKWIDPNNHDVKPIIVNGRTMLPLRFVAENLGCKVDWNGTTKTITLTYPAS